MRLSPTQEACLYALIAILIVCRLVGITFFDEDK